MIYFFNQEKLIIVPYYATSLDNTQAREETLLGMRCTTWICKIIRGGGVRV